MANVNIDAFYAGSLRIKIAYFVSEYFSFYKWCVTKVAHCTLCMPAQGSYRQVCVKFKDFSRTGKRRSYCFQGLKT